MSDDGRSSESDSDAPSVRDALRGGVSRRRFAEVLLSAGFGAAALRWLTPDDFRDAPSDEVPIVYAVTRSDPDDPTSLEPRTKTVPRDWHAELTRALKVYERRLGGGLSGLVGAFVRPGSYDGGESTAIHVDVVEAQLADRLASFAHDVELSVSQLPDLPPRPDSRSSGDLTVARDVDEPAIPGGVACGTENALATLAPAMYDPETGDAFFATANHLYGQEGTLRTRHRGRRLLVYGERDVDPLGRVARGYPDEDFVRVAPADDHLPASRIHDVAQRRVGGHFTRLGLADLKARGEPLTKVGAASCVSSGQITGIGGITCYTGEGLKNGQLKWGSEDTMTDGDSGTVSFHPDPERPDEQVLVAGFNNARTWWPGADYTWGTAAYHIYDRYGLSF